MAKNEQANELYGDDPEHFGLQVLEDYTGRPSKERTIVAGLYTYDDPRLMGAADYLVEKGFAEKVGLSENQYQSLVRAQKPKKANPNTRTPGLPDGMRGHVEPTERLNGLNTHIQNQAVADVTDEAYQGSVTDEDGEPGELKSVVPPETERLPQTPNRTRPPKK